MGKTTLALQIGEQNDALYLDLESRADRSKLADPAPSKGFHIVREDLGPRRSFIVYSGEDRYPISRDTEAIGVREMASLLTEIT